MSNRTWLIIVICIVTSALIAGTQLTSFNKPVDTWRGYEAEWTTVDSLASQGLPQSVLEAVDRILAHAKDEGNGPQTVKAVIYQAKFTNDTEEYGPDKAIAIFEKEIAAASSPVKNILQSLLAELYWQYTIANQWEISGRSTTVNFKNDDISTWNITALANKSLELYEASVKDREILKKNKTREYADILYLGNDYGNLLRPTLFDLLGQRALDFLMNDEAYITDPAYAFELKEPVIFDDSKSFAGYNFSSKDSASKKLLALHLLQELTTMHLYDPYPAALIDLDLQRFDFAKNNTALDNRDSLYLDALVRDERRFQNDSSSARISYAIANVHASNSANYNRLTGDDWKWEKKIAVDICDATIKKHPGSLGARNCEELKITLLAKDFMVTAEEINVPDKPFLASVSFTNLSNVYFRIVSVTPEEMDNISQYYNDERAEYLIKKPVIRSWKQQLPDDGDHNNHITEIKIDALPLGSYYLLSSADPNFSTDKNKLGMSELRISNLSYISSSPYYTSLVDNTQSFYITDRTTGQPIKGADITTYKREYDYNERKYKTITMKKYVTDENGLFQVSDPLLKDYYYFSFTIAYGKDFLDINNSYYLNKQNNTDKKPFVNTLFFTDRAIYRPGQTIYFKGIMMETSYNGKTKKVIANKKTTITLYDVNDQKVASLDLTTNDYGSFAGTFTAPQNGITGSMYVQNESGMQYFSVEEYKRPTFSVAMDPVQGSFTLGDSVHITGMATSYAGANIDQATVQYRVVRSISYPWYYEDYFWWKRPAPPAADMEITHGVTTTGADGKFDLDFVALADKTINKSMKPQFNYLVYADITDLSGETRSGTASVSVGYISIDASLEIPATVKAEKPVTIKFSTANLNGTPEAASGTIKIIPLETPSALLRDRTFEQPDKYIFTKDEFSKLFPNDVYKDENDYGTWKELPVVANYNWNTATADSLVMNATSFKTGKYKAVLVTQDKNGTEVKRIKYFDVLAGGNYSATPDYSFSENNWISAEPGDNAVIRFGSSAKNVSALLMITKGDGTSTTRWIHLPDQMNKNTRSSMMDIEIPVSESDRGGISAQISFIKDSRYYNESYYVSVPWDNKDLNVTLETHRDKLEPGAKETWKIKISGKHGERVAAELLANMYDASLDAFQYHSWNGIDWPGSYSPMMLQGTGFQKAKNFIFIADNWTQYPAFGSFSYDYINWFGLTLAYRGYTNYYEDALLPEYAPAQIYDKENGDIGIKNTGALNIKGSRADGDELTKAVGGAGEEVNFLQNGNSFSTVTTTQNVATVATRSILQETAFFYPQLETDSDGNIIFSFTMPEALTEWKFMAFAHTKELQSAQIFSSVVTQKELMIQPNMPRFLREGDQLEVSAKISNLTDSVLNGVAQLELYDAITLQPVDMAFANTHAQATFTAQGKQSAGVHWSIQVPEGYDAILYKVKAVAGNYTDGEENALPVLSNRILVTEALPLWVRGNKEKDFSFDRLLNSKQSSTIRTQSIALEYSSNPAWYAVQALPYMMEYPYECAEQLFNRYYSNSIATYVATSNPEIEKIFDAWKNNPSSLTSNLEKNQELKSLLLEETPWVLQAQDETERKKRVALLFDVNRMNNEMDAAISKLSKMQLPNGGWPWFNGYEDDRYITQYIVAGMAHLKALNVFQPGENRKTENMLINALHYCDNRMLEDYTTLEKYWATTANGAKEKEEFVPSSLTVQYLYARSYFNDNDWQMSPEQSDAKKYFIGQIKKYWTQYSIYEKGLIALILSRADENATALNITKSLKEYSLQSDELGMYWKDNIAGYYWNQAPVETQSLMIEVFGEVAKDPKSVEALKVWLLRQKQTNDWKTTKATAEACYALLLNGNDLLSDRTLALITVGNTLVKPENVEAGTGYFKTTWAGENAKPDFGKISITPSDKNEISWGAMYWQYFEDIDKVKASDNQLQINKQLFVQKNTDRGPVIDPVTDKTTLHVGDLVKVRIEIRVDRDMQYVHMKDMRAAGFEPTNVLSEYKWQDGLGYYEATGDAATNFFFSYLPKGTYVFEYALRVTHKGNFSNGITSAQCMYAPEFTSHSEGIRVTVQ